MTAAWGAKETAAAAGNARASSRSRVGVRCNSFICPHLLAVLAGSLFFFLFWLHPVMDFIDYLVMVGMHFICLPMVCRDMTPRLIACMGGPLCGLIAGMQLIDMCFDMLIVYDLPLSDGIDVFKPRRAAFLYYHTMLNGRHVNAALLGIILVSFLGSIVGLERSSPEMRRQFCLLGALMSVGTGGYLACAVTRYTAIRFATVYDERLFDGWEMVVAARMVLFVSITIAQPFLFGIQMMKDGGEIALTKDKLTD